jgi:hypothetical protein
MKRITPAAFLSEMKSMGWHPMTLNGSVFAYFTEVSSRISQRTHSHSKTGGFLMPSSSVLTVASGAAISSAISLSRGLSARFLCPPAPPI